MIKLQWSRDSCVLSIEPGARGGGFPLILLWGKSPSAPCWGSLWLNTTCQLLALAACLPLYQPLDLLPFLPNLHTPNYYFPKLDVLAFSQAFAQPVPKSHLLSSRNLLSWGSENRAEMPSWESERGWAERAAKGCSSPSQRRKQERGGGVTGRSEGGVQSGAPRMGQGAPGMILHWRGSSLSVCGCLSSPPLLPAQYNQRGV